MRNILVRIMRMDVIWKREKKYTTAFRFWWPVALSYSKCTNLPLVGNKTVTKIDN